VQWNGELRAIKLYIELISFCQVSLLRVLLSNLLQTLHYRALHISCRLGRQLSIARLKMHIISILALAAGTTAVGLGSFGYAPPQAGALKTFTNLVTFGDR
jgi:hypothetical protein